jgi:hypothetical protein
VVRDKGGKFVKGHPPLNKPPGRPPRAIEEERLNIFREDATPENIRAVARQLRSNGDAASFRVWLEYAIGPVPKELNLNLYSPERLAVWLSGSPSGGSTSGED